MAYPLVTAQMPNQPVLLRQLTMQNTIPTRRIWGMLFLRSGLSFAMLLVVAGMYTLAGHQNAVAASAAWWLWFVTITNVVCIALMARLGRSEGLRLRDIYFVNRSTWKSDLAWIAIAIVGSAVFGMLPGTLLANGLWGSVDVPNGMMIQALPLVAIYPLFVLMPITQGFAELPIYWGYVAPRLQAAGMGRWLVIALVGAVLSLQHMFFSFQLDWRLDLWLALKFLPFALWTGVVLVHRPTVMPYMMALHLAIDATLPLLVYFASV